MTPYIVIMFRPENWSKDKISTGNQDILEREKYTKNIQINT